MPETFRFRNYSNLPRWMEHGMSVTKWPSRGRPEGALGMAKKGYRQNWTGACAIHRLFQKTLPNSNVLCGLILDVFPPDSFSGSSVTVTFWNFPRSQDAFHQVFQRMDTDSGCILGVRHMKPGSSPGTFSRCKNLLRVDISQRFHPSSVRC